MEAVTTAKPRLVAGQDVDAARPKGKREITKYNNREAILSSARDVFSELGYGETTVRDIIRRTGLASGTFYNYFKSKEEVFEALMDDSVLRIRPRIQAERQRAKTFEEFIANSYLTYFEYLATDGATFQMLRRNPNALRVRMDTPEVLAGFEEIREYIEEDIKLGKLPNVDAEYMMASLCGIAMEVGERMLARSNRNPKEAAEFAVAMAMHGFHALPIKD
jgi:AcrR family transcriptional regulator